MNRHLSVAALAMIALAGCDKPVPAPVTIQVSREIAILPFAPSIKGRDGGFSTKIGERSAWVFGDTILAAPAVDGLSWRSSTFATTTDLDASDGITGLDEPLDANGAPGEFLPFTAAEAAYNEAHRGDACSAGSDCGARFALWPGPLVTMGTSTVLFYAKIDARPGDFNFKGIGSGVATWDGQSPPVRAVVDASAADPHVLFADDPFHEVAGALLVNDLVYAYFCRLDFVVHVCRIGRAPFTSVAQPNAWSFYDGSAWVADFKEARVVMQGAPALTVHFSPHLGKYLAIFSTPLGNTLELRVADAPEGPWSNSKVFHVGQAPASKNAWDYAGVGHAEYAREGGLVEYVTYYRPGDWSGEMRLVEVTLK